MCWIQKFELVSKTLTREQIFDLIGNISNLDDSDSDPTFKPDETSGSNSSFLCEDGRWDENEQQCAPYDGKNDDLSDGEKMDYGEALEDE